MSANNRMVWTIDVFDDATEQLVEEHALAGIAEEQLREMFGQPANARMVDSFRVSDAQARLLQSYLRSPLHLRPGRSYFLECHLDDAAGTALNS